MLRLHLVHKSLSSQFAPASLTLRKVYNHVKAMTAEDMERFMAVEDSAQIYMATLGPNDCLYTPAGFVFFERVMNKDFLGVRLLGYDVQQVDVMDAIAKHLVTINKPSLVLQKCVDQIHLAAA